jgi:hypothetical protein
MRRGQRNENLSTTPSAAELDDLAEEGPLSKTKLQFYKECKISLQTIRRPSVTEVYGNASFSPRHMENQDLAPSRHATWKQKKAAIYLYTLKRQGREDSGAMTWTSQGNAAHILSPLPITGSYKVQGIHARISREESHRGRNNAALWIPNQHLQGDASQQVTRQPSP